MKTAETPAGIFTINKVKIPSAYTCAAEQKIEYISENHMQIITMDYIIKIYDIISKLPPLNRYRKGVCYQWIQFYHLCFLFWQV